MRLRVSMTLAVALLCLAPTASWADLAPYSQDFEGLDQADPAALADDGWLVFGNVFDPDGSYLYGYGPFPAPNGGPGFSGIDVGQGGPAQGDQQLVVYSDYNNGDHGNGNFIEANVFQEQMVGAADVGKHVALRVRRQARQHRGRHHGAGVHQDARSQRRLRADQLHHGRHDQHPGRRGAATRCRSSSTRASRVRSCSSAS